MKVMSLRAYKYQLAISVDKEKFKNQWIVRLRTSNIQYIYF